MGQQHAQDLLDLAICVAIGAGTKLSEELDRTQAWTCPLGCT